MNTHAPKAVIYTSRERSFYVGRLETVLRKRNAAPILLVSAGQKLDLLDHDGRTISSSNSLLIPAGVDLNLRTHDSVVAKFFLDDLGSDMRTLAPYMKPCKTANRLPIFQDFRLEGDIIEYANYLADYRPCSEEAFDILHNWVDALNPGVKSLADPRVAKVVSLIKQNYDKNISVVEFAAQVNLSVPRLINIFNSVTGTSIRRYRNWYRIMMAAHKLSEGLSLTEAALEAGFNDYAHFSNNYRELAGASPSAARKNTEIKVLSAA